MTPKEIAEQDVGSFTALPLAKGNKVIVRALVAKMDLRDLGQINCYAYSVLDESVMGWSSLQMTDLLLENMLPEHIKRQDVSGWSALHLAAAHGKEDVVPLLLTRMPERDIWICTREPHRKTALHLAAESNSLDAVETILVTGSGYHFAFKDQNGRMTLHMAAEAGWTKVMPLLLPKMDQEDLALCDSARNTALHTAAGHGH